VRDLVAVVGWMLVDGNGRIVLATIFSIYIK